MCPNRQFSIKFVIALVIMLSLNFSRHSYDLGCLLKNKILNHYLYVICSVPWPIFLININYSILESNLMLNRNTPQFEAINVMQENNKLRKELRTNKSSNNKLSRLKWRFFRALCRSCSKLFLQSRLLFVIIPPNLSLHECTHAFDRIAILGSLAHIISVIRL